MAAEYFFAVKSIGLSKCGGRKPSSLLDAARHNKREIQAERGASHHIDARRVNRNECLSGPGTAAGVVELANRILVEAGIDPLTMRRDRCQAVEVVFSLPVDSPVNEKAYFDACLCWAIRSFAGATVLSADIHNDEAAPHLHILLSPVRNGRMVGGKMIDRAALAGLRESFWSDVAGPVGLRRANARLYGQARALGVTAVLERLDGLQAPELRGPLWPITRKAIERDPLPFLAALNIDPQGLRHDRQAKPIGIDTEGQQAKPIGIDLAGVGAPRNPQSLSCVGISTTPPSERSQQNPIKGHPVADDRVSDDGMTFQREGELPASQWSEELGEFLPSVVKRTDVRRAADLAVAAALAKRRVEG